MTLPRLPPAPHVLVAALCAGLSVALLVRSSPVPLAVAALGLAAVGAAASRGRVLALALAFFALGLWWGGLRLDSLDESVLLAKVGESALARVEVTGPTRTSSFAVRVPVRVRLWDGVVVDEAARLQLPRGRAPPQGAVLEVVAFATEPRPAKEDETFDERAYLRRQGVHVVLRADGYRIVGRRGGLGGVADGLRRSVELTMAPGLGGERHAVIAGVVLGEDEGLATDLRDRFRASGPYHLLNEFKLSIRLRGAAPNAKARRLATG